MAVELYTLNPVIPVDTVFLLAAAHGRLCLLCHLYETTQVNINTRDSNGFTALHIAVNGGFPNSSLAILHWMQKNASTRRQKYEIINSRNNEGSTPLHLAAHGNSAYLCTHLLYAGADRSLKDNYSNTPGEIAAKNSSNREVKSMLESPGCCRRKKVRHMRNSPNRFILNVLFVMAKCMFTVYQVLPRIEYEYAAISCSLSLATFVILVGLYFKDPGHVGEDKARGSLMHLFRKYGQDTCIKCGTAQNQKDVIFHCWECNQCTEEYDHHCPWIRNCVGKGNKHWFNWYLIVFELDLLFHSVILWLIFEKIINDNERVKIPIPYSEAGIDRLDYAFIATACIIMLLLSWVLYILVFQLICLFTGKTNYERNHPEKFTQGNYYKNSPVEEFHDSIRTSIKVYSQCVSTENIHNR